MEAQYSETGSSGAAERTFTKRSTMGNHIATGNGKTDLENILEIRAKLQTMLKPARYEHSLSVSFTCICLAMRYGVDLRQAELAGLVHDCAKQFSNEELLKACAQDGVALTEDMLRAPQVIHSVYGATYARTYIEARRDKAARLPEIRQLAFTDLERAVYEINHDTIHYLEASGGYICKDSYDTYQYYRTRMQERGLTVSD